MLRKIFIAIPVALFILFALYIGAHIVSLQYTKAQLDNVPDAYTYGNPDGDVTLVEFVKYTCPYCRQFHQTVIEAVRQDGNVRYIPRPLPSDVKDAQLAYAAGEQGLFHLAHGALLQDPRIMDEGGIMAIAETLGFEDMEKLKTDMDSDTIKSHIQTNIDLFYALGLQSTPTYIIGDIIFVPENTPPTVEDFLTLFNQARD